MQTSRQEFSSAKSTKCTCPMCGKTHKQLLYWTGDTTPMKFCRKCSFRNVLRNSIEGEEVI